MNAFMIILVILDSDSYIKLNYIMEFIICSVSDFASSRLFFFKHLKSVCLKKKLKSPLSPVLNMSFLELACKIGARHAQKFIIFTVKIGSICRVIFYVPLIRIADAI